MSITSSIIGSIGDRQVTAFTLANGSGLRVRILDYGGIITELHAPGRTGSADVVLGFDNLEDYLPNPAYMGAIVGRYANRIGNARFILDGITHAIDANEPPNQLHGGFYGFDRHLWQAETYTENGTDCLRLSRRSVHGEGGFPGNLDVVVVYRLLPTNGLAVEYSAMTDAATPVSLTQHSYFNLAGHDSGDIRGHRLQIFADRITESDKNLLPTGRLLTVAGTPYDFRVASEVRPDHPDLIMGYDVNYVLDDPAGELRPAAEVTDPVSGRRMRVSTTKPGIQLYDGTYLPAVKTDGKAGTRYPKWGGLCLETQHFPAAVNRPEFPSPILRPGERYEHVTVFAFDID